MANLDKKLVIIIGFVICLLGGSLYGYLSKISPPAQAVSQAVQRATDANYLPGNEVFIYISGAVTKPGVYKIPANARVLQAINAAGGLVPGADAGKINLASSVKDGMHINVPGSLGGAAAESSDKKDDKININTADKNMLDKLPGIGPALAERIIQYRQTNGLFADPSDLKKVPGIGEAKYNQLKDKITI